jgi:hydrogenase maturation protein HypF
MTAEVPQRCVGVRVRGIVQGVGFRPFVFGLAGRFGLVGWVRNRSFGVDMEIGGTGDAVKDFLLALEQEAPPLARIVSVEVEDLASRSLPGFHIVSSRVGESRRTLISPDVCTCADCLAELLDPLDRRYRYPFINCTNCGPRYTIIRDIPYDRGQTTMAPFEMCTACRAEYEDPRNRRFHAQPNACPECGPKVWLEDAEGEVGGERDDALRAALELLDAGWIVAIKGLGGFHLAVNALDPRAVARLRGRKIREEKPFALMFADAAAVRRYCGVDSTEEKLLAGLERPIVLLQRREDPEGRQIAPDVAPGNGYLGCFLPYTPLHHLLFADDHDRVLVMTSGNQSDEPIVTENEQARGHLGGIADAFLLHNREIHLRCDDSVARVLHGEPRPLRRARGYVPVPVFLDKSGPSVLGTGGELKNTVCLTREDEAFVSQHIGDLENLETLRSFEAAIEHLQRILEVQPEMIVHDLHPDYLSSRWAGLQTGTRRLAVQHHHAHVAAVAAERRLSGPLLGLALDGTGYGADGTIWGGELLLLDGHRYRRLGHLLSAGLPGGDRAAREPWRMALSYLYRLEPERCETQYGDFLARWPEPAVKVVLQMLRRGLNTPLTSSCGRLFDAVAALAGVRDKTNYEGQAAIELEQALEAEEGAYPMELREEEDTLILDPLPAITAVVADVRAGIPAGLVSARFHNGLVELLVKAVCGAAGRTGLRCIALSGGVFQNRYLSERLETQLKSAGLDVYTHGEVPPNDGCIALGQAWIGMRHLEDLRG